jgi:hypothetical protein
MKIIWVLPLEGILRCTVIQPFRDGSDWRQTSFRTAKDKVKRVLRFYKYPPDDEPRAVSTVIEQAEMHAEELV